MHPREHPVSGIDMISIKDLDKVSCLC